MFTFIGDGRVTVKPLQLQIYRSCLVCVCEQKHCMHQDSTVITKTYRRAQRVKAFLMDNRLRRVYTCSIFAASDKGMTYNGIIMTLLLSDGTAWSVWCFCCLSRRKGRLSQFEPMETCCHSFLVGCTKDCTILVSNVFGVCSTAS